MMKWNKKKGQWGLFSIAISLLLLFMVGHSEGGELELVKPDTLIVAFNGDMPGTGWQDGRLIGLDGELMHWMADQLGLKVEPALMEWSAEIASVKARRVDIMHGMMGWNNQRIKVINITDPIYYGGANITQKKGQNWNSIKDLEGKRVATITGFGWIDEIKSIPGLKLSLYDTSDAAIRDLLAGRIQALFADPPLVQYAISKNPQWNLHALPIKEKDVPEWPLLSSKYNIVFALSKEAPNLLKAVNEKIAEMWKTCLNRKIAAKYGLGDESWFTPGKNLRVGEGPDFDRPVGWKQPVSPDNCK
ncbi:MAG: ABC transporter substrate-binding protein [Desulfobacterales bacterium]